MSRHQPERALHIAVAQYLSLALRPPTFWTTFPAGSGGKARGGQLRACGLKAGCPDVLIIDEYSQASWIELKAPGGKLSAAQKVTIEALERAGCRVAVCESIEQVEQHLFVWGFNISAQVTGGKPPRRAA